MSARKNLSNIVDTSSTQNETNEQLEKKAAKTGEKKKKKEKSKVSKKSLVNIPKKKHTNKTSYSTHDGHRLTVNEAKFIDIYIETGNQRQAVIEAGYKSVNPGGYAQTLLRKEYIKSEIDYRLKLLEDEKIASADEILKFYTRVMRGEEKDQFELDVPMSERLKAANELAKRKIDIVNKVQGGKDTAEVKITLNWDGMKGVEDEQSEE